MAEVRFWLNFEPHAQNRCSSVEQSLRDSVHSIHDGAVGAENYWKVKVRILDELHMAYEDTNR